MWQIGLVLVSVPCGRTDVCSEHDVVGVRKIAPSSRLFSHNGVQNSFNWEQRSKAESEGLCLSFAVLRKVQNVVSPCKPATNRLNASSLFNLFHSTPSGVSSLVLYCNWILKTKFRKIKCSACRTGIGLLITSVDWILLAGPMSGCFVFFLAGCLNK